MTESDRAAIEKAPLVSSLLVLRKPFALRHPRVFGALAYCTLGALSGALAGCLGCMVFHDGTFWIWTMLAGAVGALGPGATIGASVFKDSTITEKDARRIGALIVIRSHVCLGAIGLVTAACSVLGHAVSLGWSALLILLLLSFLMIVVYPAGMLLVTCAITMPAGIFGTKFLIRYRDRATAPLGCRLHGYGATTDGATGDESTGVIKQSDVSETGRISNPQ